MLKSLIKKDHTPLKSITIKLTADEIELIKEKSRRYAGSNMSAWVRYASIEMTPSKTALE